MSKLDDFLDQDVLMKSLQYGNEDAYIFLFQKYYNNLLNYACRILRDENIADDVVQDVFCSLFLNRDKINLHESINSYLYKSIFNRACNVIRHNKVVANYADDFMLNMYLNEMVQRPDAEIQLHNSDLSNAIKDAMDNLPERCREVFVMSKIDGLSNKEIADKLGISIKTVEQQMTKAYMRLRKDLDWILIVILLTDRIKL